ncbi:MAG: hypothetical protein KAR14_08335 [Candidatus Aminicenantes bacterium]|nr:hypothetical protein [Candidatus Aminicenantes bacterium]
MYLKNAKNKTIKSWDLKAKSGINRINWDFLIDGKYRKNLPTGRRPFILPGKYTLVLKAMGKTDITELIIDKPEKKRNWWDGQEKIR